MLHSLLVWGAYFLGSVTLYDDGPTAVFFTAKVSTLGIIVSCVLFLLGVCILFAAIRLMRNKETKE